MCWLLAPVESFILNLTKHGHATCMLSSFYSIKQYNFRRKNMNQ
jgi:hypothetical protein